MMDEQRESRAARDAQEHWYDGPEKSDYTVLTCNCASEDLREWENDEESIYCSACESWVEPA